MKLQADSIQQAKAFEKTNDLLIPHDWTTFPMIYIPTKEFLGGAEDLLDSTFNNVTYSLSQDIKSHDKSCIRFIINELGPYFFPHCVFREGLFHTTKNHIHIELLSTDLMLEHMVSNKHIKTSRTEVEELRGFSVTCMGSRPRYIYLNFENWNNVNGCTNHFTNRFMYKIYVMLHELGHAIGLRHHMTGSYNKRLQFGKSTRHCRLMSQQTLKEFKHQKCQLMNLSYLKTILPPALYKRVENMSKQLKTQHTNSQSNNIYLNKSNEFDSMASSTGNMSTSYSQYFDTPSTVTRASNIDLSSITGGSHNDDDGLSSIVSMNNQSEFSQITSNLQGGLYDGTTIETQTGELLSPTAENSSKLETSDIYSDVDSAISDRFDDSKLKGGSQNTSRAAQSYAEGASQDTYAEGASYAPSYAEGASQAASFAPSHVPSQSSRIDQSTYLDSSYASDRHSSDEPTARGFISDSNDGRSSRSVSPSELLDQETAISHLQSLATNNF